MKPPTRLADKAFFKAAALLGGSTALGNSLMLLALPVLTRLYSPTDFGILGVFAALLGTIGAASSLRYEIAIPIASSSAEAANLLGLALFVGLSVGIMTAFIVMLWSHEITHLVNASGLSPHLWLLPLAIIAVSGYRGFQYWAIRTKSFERIALTKLEQSIGGTLTQLGFGLAGAGPVGLIVGQIVSNSAGLFGLGRRAFAENSADFKTVDVAGMRSVAREFIRFPKYSALEALCNSAAVQVPLLLIAALANATEVGFLVLAMRLQAPIALIGTSISQVYLSRAEADREKGQLGQITLELIESLAKYGVGPLACAAIVAPSVFGLAFGPQWSPAGELIVWLVPWFALQMLSSPVSMALHVTSHQRTALVLQIIGLFMRVSMVAAAGAGALLSLSISQAYAVSGLLFYLVYIIVILSIVGVTFRQAAEALARVLPALAAWIALGLTMNFLIERLQAVH